MARSVYFIQRQQKVFLVLVVFIMCMKFLIKGECELNYQKHRGERGKKDLTSLHISVFSQLLKVEVALS